MLKKTAALSLILIILFSFFACKKEENPYIASPLEESVFISSEKDPETTLEYDVYEDYVIITGAAAPLATLYVPETINDKEVKAIDKDAFTGMTGLKAVTISDNVVEIRENAFAGCTSLSNIVLSENLYSIGTSAFYGNKSLQSIRIPLGVKVIGGYAFGECTSLKNIVVPKQTESIGGGAFQETPWLKNQKDEFIIAGQNILIHYNGTETEVEIPEGIVEVSGFYENFFIEKVIIPESVTRIGEYSFWGSALKSISLGENVTVIGASAFNGCLNFNKIKFSENITFIGEYTFSGCQALEEITIPESVTYVGDGTFARCDSIKKITFLSKKTEIGEDICESCSSLKKIACPKKSPVIDYAKEKKINIDII